MIDDALRIIGQWPRFAKDFKDPDHFFTRVVLPQRLGQMRIVGDLFYTWARVPYLITELPTIDDWVCRQGNLWLMDLVFGKSMTAREAMRLCNNDLQEAGIAKAGERALFYRGVHDRYGYGIVQEIDDEQRTKDPDGGQRPMGDDARLHEGCAGV